MANLLSHQLRRVFNDKKARFIAAGILNTLVDFVVFNAGLVVFGRRLWLANIISTTVAMIVSFVVNKKAVFRDTRRFSHRQLLMFIITTAVGLWGLQTAAILGATVIIRPPTSLVLRRLHFAHATNWVVPNLAKALAIVLSAIWNYFWYDRVIFTDAGNIPDAQEWI